MDRISVILFFIFSFVLNGQSEKTFKILTMNLARRASQVDNDIQIKDDGKVFLNNHYLKNPLLEDLNVVIGSKPTGIKFERLRGQEFGCKYFFYQNSGFIAYSGPSKRKMDKYFIMNIEAFFNYNKLYRRGNLFDSRIIINNVEINKNTRSEERRVGKEC